MDRRNFLKATSGTIAGLSLGAPAFGTTSGEHIPLGIDGYCIRGMGFNIFQFIDYAVSVNADIIQASFRREFESLDEGYLKKVREYAKRCGVLVEPIIASACSYSKLFNARELGTPTEHLLLGLNLAKAVGASTVKVFLGGREDRYDNIPMSVKMEATVEALRSVRSRAVDAGVKYALETHGDLLAREVKMIIEEAGPEFVGCCLDTGNPVSLAESPFLTLEILGPYTITTQIRDSVIYEHPRGAAYQWVALGDGSIDFKSFVDRHRELCPKAPFILEILTGSPPRVLPFLEEDYWEAFPDMTAADFARFLSLVKNGHPFTGSMMSRDQPPEYAAAMREQQRFDLERSLEYAKKVLDLGVCWRKK